MKVSLRERYKQADLEGIALRQVYRNAETYLITMSDEAINVSEKIENGDIAGLTKCIMAEKEDYTTLLERLHVRKFSKAVNIMPISGTFFPISNDSPA